MLGLIIKDIRLIKNQGIIMILFLVVIMGSFMINTMNGVGFVAFVSLMGNSYALATISYDTYENGCSFLFTLPVSRKLYVAEKYVLAILFSLGACLAAGFAAELIKGDLSHYLNNCLSYLMTWATVLWTSLLMIPLRLKFGAEKGRIVTGFVFGICAALGFLASGPMRKAAEGTVGLINRLNQTMGDAGLPVLILLITAAAYAISMCISMHIMEKKEF